MVLHSERSYIKLNAFLALGAILVEVWTSIYRISIDFRKFFQSNLCSTMQEIINDQINIISRCFEHKFFRFIETRFFRFFATCNFNFEIWYSATLRQFSLVETKKTSVKSVSRNMKFTTCSPDINQNNQFEKPRQVPAKQFHSTVKKLEMKQSKKISGQQDQDHVLRSKRN